MEENLLLNGVLCNVEFSLYNVQFTVHTTQIVYNSAAIMS